MFEEKNVVRCYTPSHRFAIVVFVVFGTLAFLAWYGSTILLAPYQTHCYEVDAPCLPLLIPILVAVGILLLGVGIAFPIADVPQQRSVDSERNP